ncbi:MAG: hypothetical protein QXT63_01000 [Thermoplasmata archaeon]
MQEGKKCTACGAPFGNSDRCEKCGLPKSKLGVELPKEKIDIKKRDPIIVVSAILIAVFVLIGCTASAWLASELSNDKNSKMTLSVDAPENGIYIVKVSTIDSKKEIAKLSYELKSPSGEILESNKFADNISANVSLVDENSDSYLSKIDYFIVRGKDATPPGLGERDCMLVILENGTRLGSILLP